MSADKIVDYPVKNLTANKVKSVKLVRNHHVQIVLQQATAADRDIKAICSGSCSFFNAATASKYAINMPQQAFILQKVHIKSLTHQHKKLPIGIPTVYWVVYSNIDIPTLKTQLTKRLTAEAKANLSLLRKKTLAYGIYQKLQQVPTDVTALVKALVNAFVPATGHGKCSFDMTLGQTIAKLPKAKPELIMGLFDSQFNVLPTDQYFKHYWPQFAQWGKQDSALKNHIVCSKLSSSSQANTNAYLTILLEGKPLAGVRVGFYTSDWKPLSRITGVTNNHGTVDLLNVSGLQGKSVFIGIDQTPDQKGGVYFFKEKIDLSQIASKRGRKGGQANYSGFKIGDSPTEREEFNLRVHNFYFSFWKTRSADNLTKFANNYVQFKAKYSGKTDFLAKQKINAMGVFHLRVLAHQLKHIELRSIQRSGSAYQPLYNASDKRIYKAEKSLKYGSYDEPVNVIEDKIQHYFKLVIDDPWSQHTIPLVNTEMTVNNTDKNTIITRVKSNDKGWVSWAAIVENNPKKMIEKNLSFSINLNSSPFKNIAFPGYWAAWLPDKTINPKATAHRFYIYDGTAGNFLRSSGPRVVIKVDIQYLHIVLEATSKIDGKTVKVPMKNHNITLMVKDASEKESEIAAVKTNEQGKCVIGFHHTDKYKGKQLFFRIAKGSTTFNKIKYSLANPIDSSQITDAQLKKTAMYIGVPSTTNQKPVALQLKASRLFVRFVRYDFDTKKLVAVKNIKVTAMLSKETALEKGEAIDTVESKDGNVQFTFLGIDAKLKQEERELYFKVEVPKETGSGHDVWYTWEWPYYNRHNKPVKHDDNKLNNYKGKSLGSLKDPIIFHVGVCIYGDVYYENKTANTPKNPLPPGVELQLIRERDKKVISTFRTVLHEKCNVQTYVMDYSILYEKLRFIMSAQKQPLVFSGNRRYISMEYQHNNDSNNAHSIPKTFAATENHTYSAHEAFQIKAQNMFNLNKELKNNSLPKTFLADAKGGAANINVLKTLYEVSTWFRYLSGGKFPGIQQKNRGNYHYLSVAYGHKKGVADYAHGDLRIHFSRSSQYWGRRVIAHEFGHAIHHFMVEMHKAQGDRNYISKHYYNWETTTYTAESEGWAEFIAMLFSNGYRNSRLYKAMRYKKNTMIKTRSGKRIKLKSLRSGRGGEVVEGAYAMALANVFNEMVLQTGHNTDTTTPSTCYVDVTQNPRAFRRGAYITERQVKTRFKKYIVAPMEGYRSMVNQSKKHPVLSQINKAYGTAWKGRLKKIYNDWYIQGDK